MSAVQFFEIKINLAKAQCRRQILANWKKIKVYCE